MKHNHESLYSKPKMGPVFFFKNERYEIEYFQDDGNPTSCSFQFFSFFFFFFVSFFICFSVVFFICFFRFLRFLFFLSGGLRTPHTQGTFTRFFRNTLFHTMHR